MFTIIFLLALVGLGIWIEKRYNPRFSVEASGIVLHYTAKRGARNCVNLKDIFK